MARPIGIRVHGQEQAGSDLHDEQRHRADEGVQSHPVSRTSMPRRQIASMAGMATRKMATISLRHAAARTKVSSMARRSVHSARRRT